MAADRSLSSRSEPRVPTASVSLAVLREHGEPMTLRELTAASAQAMKCPLMYLDVEAVMGRHLDEGQVTVTLARDYRDHVWEVA